MKRTSLALVLATMAIVPGMAWSQARAESPVALQAASVSVAKQTAKQSIIKSGKFMAGEHPTQGDARIVMENGRAYLELGSNFMSDAGPDLHVVLHQSAQPGLKLNWGEYVILGVLQNTSGAQRYAIPNNVDLSKSLSAAIWCHKFNATFGSASFN